MGRANEHGEDIVLTEDAMLELRSALNLALKREARLARIVESLPEAIFVTSVEGIIQSWNPAAEAMFGYPAGDVLGLHVSLLGPSDGGKRIRKILRKIVAGENIDPFELTHLISSGEELLTKDTVEGIRNTDGELESIAWSSRDISELQRLERIVWEEKERTESAFGIVSDAVLMTDDKGRIAYLNPAASLLTGWSIAEAHGKPIESIAMLEHEETRDRVTSPVYSALNNGEPVEAGFHSVIVRRDGVMFPVEDAAVPIAARDGSMAGAVLTLRPVGRNLPGTAPTNYVPIEDPATGILGRREIEHRLEQALLTAGRNNTHHTLLALKVQGFRELVNRHGQVAGDELLRQIAVMLRTQIREMDLLARLQHGEYAILLQHCPIDEGQRIAQQARRILRNFSFSWAGIIHDIIVQFGVVPVTPDSGDVNRILQIADVACQLADTDGIDLVHVLDVGDINRAMSSRRWDRTRQVSRALNENRFRLFGQAIHPLATNGEYGQQIELFVHMLDDLGDVVEPHTFLPAAERMQLSGEVDCWVIQRVFEMLAGRYRSDVASWTINLSEMTVMDPSFSEFVEAQLHRTRTPAQSICFEIDEGVATQHLGAMRQLLEALRPLGYAFCISGFGGSPQSFAYLRNLPVDYLKIDGSLSQNIQDDAVDRAIVDSIVNVARAMDIRTIASMVEQQDSLDILRVLGVDYVQGYAVAEPLPIPTFPNT